MSKYSKNHHCNNCKHYYVSQDTVYNPNHGGNPGCNDYEVETMWCCAHCDDHHTTCIPLGSRRYNCPLWIDKNANSAE
jgi:hypothetical protein